MIKLKNLDALIIGMKIIYMVGQCHKSFQHLILNGLKIPLSLMKISLKNYDEKNEVGSILEVNFKYPKELYAPHNDLPFLPERKKRH